MVHTSLARAFSLLANGASLCEIKIINCSCLSPSRNYIYCLLSLQKYYSLRVYECIRRAYFSYKYHKSATKLNCAYFTGSGFFCWQTEHRFAETNN